MVSENYARNCPLQTCCDDCHTETTLEQSKQHHRTAAVRSRFHEDKIESMNEVSATANDELPGELVRLVAGFSERLPDTAEPPPLPDWANVEKVKRGQQFGLKYLYGLNYSQTLSLLYLFAAPDGLRPLIFTEKSHTPFLAHKRYLSTALRVKSWYETDFWQPATTGYENLVAVKSLHLNVSKRLSELSADEIQKRCNLEKKLGNGEYDGNGVGMLCPLQRILKADFGKHAHDVIPDIICKINANNAQRIYLNQSEMSMTQFGFFGLMLVYPEKFGARNATEDELECFVHMWRLLGYLLGIQDEYNFCDGDLATVTIRSKQFIEHVMKPMILHVTKDWEHMARCAFQGIEKFTKLRINFESTMLYFCWILDIPTPKLFEFLSWKELIMFHFTKFVMTEGNRIPGFAKFFNYKITKTIEKAQNNQ